MNDVSAVYNSGGVVPVSLDAFKSKACSKIYFDGFVQPTSEEITALIELAGFTQAQVAKLIGVSYSIEKGSSTVRKWQTTSKKGHRKISYSSWRLLLIYSGVVDIDSDILKINNNNTG